MTENLHRRLADCIALYKKTTYIIIIQTATCCLQCWIHSLWLCILYSAGAVATFVGVSPSDYATSLLAITWPWRRTVDWSWRTRRRATPRPLPSASGPPRSVLAIPYKNSMYLSYFYTNALQNVPLVQGSYTVWTLPRVFNVNVLSQLTSLKEESK